MTVRKILVQTTIPSTLDDWAIDRFSQMVALLGAQRDARGAPLFEVQARDRDSGARPDSVLSQLDTSDVDVLWLLAVDVGNGLHPEECRAIERFRLRGGGLMVARDHMDLGSSVCDLNGIGLAHHFHTRNQEGDASRRVNDDVATSYIHWPNYHSGRNGDYQELQVCGAIHPVLADPGSASGAIRFFPAHPHEGAVSAPPDQPARVIACGRSKVSGEQFNLVVAFERHQQHGRAIAQSTFHHFADYNWDARTGCPGFVSEAPGDGMSTHPAALADIHRYVINVARWLAGDL
ncbi:hypothetical protein SAMN05216319_1334 [Duganella sp. CF402]|uniref:hypothetical protein n=1 Tax=unclassified Duganella TaxID=2636909 RepID=UPI0008B42391|nr:MULTISPECIES: hypothetical protein [unclassified Duganella]RZT10210.1 hypothetical protein EV582_2291 [Duganella sp. BK701]SEL23312.1 hypothetical protein SAMN05216319_1334 [Duganella sp. CF402]